MEEKKEATGSSQPQPLFTSVTLLEETMGEDLPELPLTVLINQVTRAARSHFPGDEADRRLKTSIVKAFGSSTNPTAVCQEIASNALTATYPSGSKFKPEQFCAIVKKASYEFDDCYITDNMGSYMEFEFTGLDSAESLAVVIKHTYVDSEEERVSATQVRNQIAAQAVAHANHPTLE